MKEGGEGGIEREGGRRREGRDGEGGGMERGGREREGWRGRGEREREGGRAEGWRGKAGGKGRRVIYRRDGVGEGREGGREESHADGVIPGQGQE